MNGFRFPRLKPGWYFLAGLAIYAVITTALLLRVGSGESSNSDADAAQPSLAAAEQRAAPGLWFPIPGARLPASDDNLPSAPRAYRHGVSQGFDFYDEDAGIPIVNGTPAVAADDGEVIRADVSYTEIDPRAWELLIEDVAEAGADEEQLDKLRGRQVWIRTEDGTVLRYGHLASIRTGIREGVTVYRGQVIGFVGNSGTDRAVAGTTDAPRLRFEIWNEDGDFFGAGMDASDVRLAAASLFMGP